MFDIAGLRQARAAKVKELEALGITANSSDEDLVKVEALQAEIDSLDRKVAAAEKAQRARAVSAQGVEGSDPPEARIRVPAEAREPAEKGLLFAQAARALVVGKGRLEDSQRFAVGTWGERHPVAQEIGAALTTNSAESGGFLVPERFSAEIIDLLYPRTTIRRNVQAAGRVVPLVGGTDQFPTVESGTSAYYNGEGQDITSSEPTFGNIKMTEREIVGLVPISNKLLRHAAVGVDRLVRDMIVQSFAQTEDAAFMRGTGTGPSPKGIRYFTHTDNVFAANGTVSVDNIIADVRKAELKMMEADMPMISVRWLLSPRVFAYLRDLRNTANDTLMFPTLSASTPTWRGYPVDWTNNVPSNLGAGSDESEVYLIDYSFCMIADSFNIRVDASDVAAYKAGSDLVSAFSRNQTVIKATAGHEFAMTRTRGAVVLTGVKWGA